MDPSLFLTLLVSLGLQQFHFSQTGLTLEPHNPKCIHTFSHGRCVQFTCDGLVATTGSGSPDSSSIACCESVSVVGGGDDGSVDGGKQELSRVGKDYSQQ